MNTSFPQPKVLSFLQSAPLKLSMLCLQLLALGFAFGASPGLLLGDNSQTAVPLGLMLVFVAFRALRNFGQLLGMLAK